MKHTAKFIGLFLVAISYSMGLWGLGETAENPKDLPDALVSLCFSYLDIRDFANVPCTCSLWKELADDEALWDMFGNRITGVAINKKGTWKQAVKDWVMIAPHVLKGKGEHFELEYAVSDDGFYLLEQHFLNNLKKDVVNKIKPQIVSPVDLLAAFYAYDVVYVAAPQNALFTVAVKSGWNALGWADGMSAWDRASNAAAHATNEAAWHHANVAVRRVARQAISAVVGENKADFIERGAWYPGGDAAGSAAEKAAQKIAKLATKRAIDILKTKEPNLIGGVAYKLSALSILTYMYREKTYFDLFMKTFLEVRKLLKKYGALQTTNKILPIISGYTGAEAVDPSLADNSHRIAIMNFLEELSLDIKEENTPRRKSLCCCLM